MQSLVDTAGNAVAGVAKQMRKLLARSSFQCKLCRQLVEVHCHQSQGLLAATGKSRRCIACTRQETMTTMLIPRNCTVQVQAAALVQQLSSPCQVCTQLVRGRRLCNQAFRMLHQYAQIS